MVITLIFGSSVTNRAALAHWLSIVASHTTFLSSSRFVVLVTRYLYDLL
jgi:hypothetical protein